MVSVSGSRRRPRRDPEAEDVPLHPTLDTGVPTETAAVVHAEFPRGRASLSLRDALGPIYADAPFADMFARDGQPAGDT